MNQGIVHGLEAITQVTFLMHDRENVIVDYVIDTGWSIISERRRQ